MYRKYHFWTWKMRVLATFRRIWAIVGRGEPILRVQTFYAHTNLGGGVGGGWSLELRTMSTHSFFKILSGFFTKGPPSPWSILMVLYLYTPSVVFCLKNAKNLKQRDKSSITSGLLVEWSFPLIFALEALSKSMKEEITFKEAAKSTNKMKITILLFIPLVLKN